MILYLLDRLAYKRRHKALLKEIGDLAAASTPATADKDLDKLIDLIVKHQEMKSWYPKHQDVYINHFQKIVDRYNETRVAYDPSDTSPAALNDPFYK